MNIEKQLVDRMQKSTGGDPEKMVSEMLNAGVSTKAAVLRYLVHAEFWEEYTKGGRTARDIEQDLTVKYGRSYRTIVRYRNHHAAKK